MLIGGRPALPFVTVAIIFNVFLQLAELLEAELFSRNEGMVIASSSVKQSLGGAFATLLALAFKAPVIVFAGLTGFQSLLRLTFLKKHVPLKAYLRFPPSLSSAKKLIVKGLPVMGSNLLFVAYLRSDQIMLEWLRGSADLGIYSVAIKVSECFYFFPFILAQTFMPYLRSRKNEGTQPVAAINLESVKLLNKLSWLSGLLISVLIALVVPQLIIPIFGDKFLDSANVLIWLAPLGCYVSNICIRQLAPDFWFQNHCSLEEFWSFDEYHP